MNETNPNQANISNATHDFAVEKLHLGKIWFSLQGRIPRSVYWANLLFGTTLGLLSNMLVDLMGITALVIVVPLFIAMLYAGVAVYVKRWHDRDKSGWWTMLCFVPIIGTLWTLIELGFMRGTTGTNRFGVDSTHLY